jgi:DNA (cytosine-5)-methyltransferase 1
MQVLDTLFFDFIDLAKRLQPKVVIAENVKGLLMGDAKKYVVQIYREFEKAGYVVQHWLMDASKMGVPQRRERVFFIALRNDLCEKFNYEKDLFTIAPKLELNFSEQEIPYKEIEEEGATIGETKLYPSTKDLWGKVSPGQSFSVAHPTGAFHGMYKVNPERALLTITAHLNGGDGYHYETLRTLTTKELIYGGTFPEDYDFTNQKSKYFIGMSVPPVMVAQIAKQVYEQWLSKI